MLHPQFDSTFAVHDKVTSIA